MKKITKLHLAQQDVYYEQVMNLDSSLYNTGGYVVFKGELITSRLKSIIEDSSKVFDVFNVKFDFTGDEPVQYFSDSSESLFIEELDLSSVSDPKKSALDWMQSQFNIAFDLGQDKLYRLVLIKVSEDEHALFGCFHHLITDGFGFAIYIKNIIDEYKFFLNEGSETTISYPTYNSAVKSSIDYLESKHYKADEIYWKEKYNIVPEVLLNQKRKKEDKGCSFSVPISKIDNTLLDRVCEQTKANISQLTIAALLLYFGKTTEHKVFSFGLPLHKRSGREERKTVGMFSGVLPFKGEFIADQLLSELISDIRHTQRDDFRHSLYPVSHLNRSLKLLSESRLQLFDVVINYELLPFPDSVSSDLSVNIKELKSTTDLGVPLSIRWVDYGKNTPLELYLDYQEAYFNKEEIELLAERLLFILRQFESSLSQPVQNISILSNEETHQLLEEFNNTTVSYSKDKTVVDLFKEQASKTPEAVAVVNRDDTLTYKELDERSNQLANYLCDKGITADSLVGICMDRGLEIVVGILGVLKAGGAYVPVDPEYPENRMAYMLADSAVDVVLCTDSSCEVLDTFKGFSVFNLDRDWETISHYPTENLTRSIASSDLAYVMYTSGSTGKPKGVMMPHKALFNLISFDYQLGISSRKVAQFTSISFDVSFLEIFFTITQGGELHIVPSVLKSDLAGLTTFINDHAIETVFLPTSFFHFIGAENVLGKLQSLKDIIVAGEQLQLSNNLKKDLNQIGVTLHNHYGPTEAHVVTTKKVDYNADNSEEETILIGKPIANTQIYILNDDLDLIPTGSVGELCIGGDCVARGYFNKKELTNEKFVVNPFKTGHVLYKTGDLARWSSTGNIEFIGRKDDQVKIRGYRIELGEVESALSRLSGVSQCCVLAKEDNSGNNRLIAYVVTEGDLDKEALQSSLLEGLPEYMVPQLWVSLDEMALTSNGKIDKKALPDLDSSTLSNKEYVAPRTETEEQLSEIWIDLLNVERVGVYDNFFELGGHSLLATRLVSIIRKELDIEIAIRDVFTYTTIDSLAGYLSNKTKGTRLPKVTSVEQIPEKVPLSFSQERLWFLDQLQGSLEYHMPFALRFSGDLDEKALSNSLQEIVRRHEILRTVVYSEEGIGYQKLLPADEWELSRKDLTNDGSLLEEDIKGYLSIPFDLTSDYMFRLRLYDLGEKQYVLTGTIHHISSDGWSQGILINEFVELYRSYLSGEPTNLPALPLQYRDYALWQRSYLEGAIIDSQLSYWEDKLKEVNTLQLPTDHVRPSVRSISGSSVSFKLTHALSEHVKTLSKSEDVTVFMTLLSAFKLLLSRYSGQEDICVGTPIANRTQKELEGIIGFFVNTLALRTQIKGDRTFKELLQDVKQTTLEAYDHQQVPFEKVVERVVKTRDMSMSPLFQVLFVLQNTPESRVIELDGLTMASDEGQKEVSSKFDLTMTLNETATEFSIDIEYCTELFKEETIQRLFTHYQELLESIVKSPSTQLDSLSILPEEEIDQLLHVFNDTEIAYPENKTIVDLIETQALKTPNAIAVVFEEGKLSYKELNERSNQLANYLIAKGIQPDDLVGICIERSLEMLVGILGILKSGGAYVPIDPEYPQARIDYMLEDSGVKVVLSASDCVTTFSAKEDLGIVLLDSDWSVIAKESMENIKRVSSPDNLAYVIYTSGSTGNPKGVMNAHKGILNRLLWTQETYGLTSEDVVLQKTTFSFDVSVWELLWPLVSGSKLVFARSGGQADATYLKRLIEAEQVTTIHFVPSMLSVFLAGLTTGDCSSLSRVLCSGEALTLEQVQAFRELFPTQRFDNLYGPTEAAIDVSSWQVPEDVNSLRKVPIGSPVSNTGLYVLDTNENLVPIGVVGELCIDGAQLAKGYLNREDLTNQQFVKHPFRSEERMYKTGDLARWLSDGTIEYVGRKDTQVKVRGYRIELGEIEYALSLLSEVTQSCVMAKKDTTGANVLVAYVVTEGELDKEALQEKAGEGLPEYMVPQLWVKLEEMPLTSNGKLDRKALPSLDYSVLSSKEYVAPRTEIEEQLSKIWKELLNVEKVGVYDNFFELGGHSLLATRLVSIIRKELEVEIAIRDVFIHTTIDSLGVHLSRQTKGILLPKVVVVDQKPSRVPLSFSQESLWFMDQLQGSLEYHQPFAFRLSGDLDKNVLAKSLHEVVNRHEVLRTVIYSEEGVGYQKVLSADNWKLSHKEIAHNTLLREDIKVFLSEPFDLASDYMFRSCLYDLGDNQYVLAGVFHHISSDAWSQGILVKEFTEIYRSYASGKEVKLPSLPLQYMDYSLWQRTHLDGPIIEEQLSYWESKLTGVSDLQLPTDYMRPSTQSVSGSSITFDLSDSLSAGINALSQSENVTVFMTLLTGFKILLSRYSGQKDICVGTSIANRTQEELEGMIGFFVNTLALRSEITEGSSFQELLQAVKQTTLDAYDHQQVPLEKVVDRVVETRDKSMNPLFQVLFVLQNTVESESIELNEVTLSDYEDDIKETANFDLKMTVNETDTTFSININYCTDLFKEETIQRIAAHYQHLLEGIVKSPSEELGNLSMLTDDESEQLLNVFNETGISYEKANKLTVVDLFEQQAKKTPNAVALKVEGSELSYSELDKKSNQVARCLIAKGITPDTLVGLCLDRSLDMMIGVLGILKSGGAYVPIDPGYPDSRINYVLDDSGVIILLSDCANLSRFSDRETLDVITLDADNNKLSEESTESIARVSSLDNLAYVIYTSGSTGNPKGVLIAHSSLIDYHYGITGKTNILDCSSFGLTSSIATDLGNTVIYTSLLQGASLYIFSEDELIDSEKLSKMSIDCLKMVPSHWKTLQQEGQSFAPNKCLLLGGEQFTHDVIDLLISQEVDCEVYNHYGPTETTIGKLIKKVSLEEKKGSSVSLGVPFGETNVLVLDSEDNLCPIGVAGELCIGGAGLAVGYLNREALTKEVFVEHPFRAGEKIYRTGDLARWLSNGEIEFIGRKDNQIKIRGYRIELGEIENVLSSIAGIDHSCVLARADEHGDKRLIGYVVLKGDLDKEALQKKIGERLPEYMVPQLWVKLDEMPLTNNGKIDRKNLPDPESSELSSKDYVAPKTASEKQLVEIWQDLLKVEKVGVYDNFFELGGQSLLAIRLIARIQKLGYTVNIKDFYADPNIALLSTKLVSVDKGYQVPKNGIVAGSSQITPSMVSLIELSQEEIDRVIDHAPGGVINIQDIYPLSPLQEGIYFHHLMSDRTKGDPYVVSNLISFSSLEQRSKFIEGLRFVIGRHDVFRTCVLSAEFSQAVQVVLREVDLPVEELLIDNSQDVLKQVEQELLPDSLYMDLAVAPMLELKTADDTANETYYLVLNYHHLMIDAVGMSKVREEIKFYLLGKAGFLPTPSLYRDFIGDTLNQDKLKESEDYFNKLYKDVETPTYPFNMSDNKIDGESIIVSSKSILPPDLGAVIRNVSNDLKVSPAVLFHAAFGLVVGRCSNTDYALFGSALLGRLQGAKGSESSLGLFMNTLPVLLDLKGDVSTYINHVNERLQALLPHEQTPLSKVHNWSGVSNDVPMFSALLNYRHSESSSTSTINSDLDIKLLSGQGRTNYPFHLDVDDYGDEFGLTFKLSDVGVDPSTVGSYMEEALTVLLKDIGKESPSEQIADLSILPEKEVHQLLEIFNDTTVVYPEDQTVVDLIEAQVNETPEAVAVVFEGATLTYKELDERSNQLAHYLTSNGIEVDTLVGICVDRSLEMIIGILGILKSGGAYVPIDPEYPQDRIDYMLEDSMVTVLLSDRKSTASVSRKTDLQVLLLDSDWDEKIGGQSVKRLKRISSPNNLAYAIYTSGSTGKPKGVSIAHASLSNFLLSMVDRLEMKDMEVFLSVTTYTFDIFYLELFTPLLVGAKVVVLDSFGIKDESKLLGTIANYSPEFMQATPSTWQMLMDAGWKNNEGVTILTGGEAITESLKNSLTEVSSTVWNLYGPTEAAIWVTAHKLEFSDAVSIGRAISNVELYILDPNDNIVPLGVTGELCIGGVQVSDGYLNRKELTAEKFIINPFKKGEKIYRTGDLAKWLPDGSVDLIGRIDNQIKIRGHRIELGEIENALSLLPGVTQCSVLAKELPSGSKQLVGYVVLEGELDKNVLQNELKQSLPEYMVPSIWISLEEMPLTANGKLDRKSLPEIDSSEFSTKEYVAPRTETEIQLVAIWQDLLGVEKVGVYDNFFELGGHSLLATRLVSMIRKELDMGIEIREIFNFSTVEELSSYLDYKVFQFNDSMDEDNVISIEL